MKIRKDQVLYLAVLLVPLLVALMFHPLYLFATAKADVFDIKALVAIATLMMNIAITPAYVILAIRYFITKRNYSYLVSLLVGLISVLGSIAVQYLNWGISTGMLMNPDSGTLMIMPIEIGIAFTIFVIGIEYVYKEKERAENETRDESHPSDE